MVFLALVARSMVNVGIAEWSRHQFWPRVVFVTFVATIAGLMYGVLVFLVSRLGYYVRFSRFVPGQHQPDLALPDATSLPSLVVLVPSYKEDAITIRQTLLSAALQDYPGRHIVLLLDDPPFPTTSQDRALIASARAMPAEISRLLAEPLSSARRLASDFEERTGDVLDPTLETRFLKEAYVLAANWFDRQASKLSNTDHVGDLYRGLVFERHRDMLEAAAENLSSVQDALPAHAGDFRMRYERLIHQFNVDITVFERKRYANISHEANKAANLNSYINLIGKTVREVRVSGEVLLSECDCQEPGAIVVRDAEFIVTLDADSLIAPDYARRLMAVMEAPGNERLAVVQTPYSAIPNAPSVIERIAGATTDIQYVVHQGFTWLGATFWVGANALLRKVALDDICTIEMERGYEIPKFIQDKTVIEDTESSIDLVANGWQLHNEPLRLAYSATPPDFGSLLIQRRRWANGGLLILPKLARFAIGRNRGRFGFIQLIVRVHYLSSLALANVSLLLLLLLPVGKEYLSPWLALAGVPYFLLYWQDLRLAGYRGLDCLRVYSFNWLLVPVNLAGVMKSLHQGITGQKTPFGRTPKVTGRTAAPAWSILSLWAMVIYMATGAFWNAFLGHWSLFAFSATTTLAIGYAAVKLVGIRSGLEDVRPIWQASMNACRSLLTIRQQQPTVIPEDQSESHGN